MHAYQNSWKDATHILNHLHSVGLANLYRRYPSKIRATKLIEILGCCQTQRTQYPLIKEYTLNYRGLIIMVLKYIP